MRSPYNSEGIDDSRHDHREEDCDYRHPPPALPLSSTPLEGDHQHDDHFEHEQAMDPPLFGAIPISEYAASTPTEEQSEWEQGMKHIERWGDENLEQIKAESYDAWYRMIQEYTRRKTTVDTDRFPALEGLAREFATISQDQYVSGLWVGDIAFGLLWSRGRVDEQQDSWRPETDRKFTLKKPSSKRACSWSWAALDGPRSFDTLVKHMWTRRRVDILIKEPSFAQEDLAKGYDPFSSNLVLNVTGIVDTFEALTGWAITEDKIDKTDYWIEEGYIVLDAPEHDPLEVLKDTVYLLLVKGDLDVEGLLLHKVGASDSTFRRIGMGSWIRIVSDAENSPTERITLV
jgi:hypothetical protein